MLDTLNSERFADMAPAAVHAALLDEGLYLRSVRTLYRVLAANGELRERRDQLAHPAYSKPKLLAIASNQVWSWDALPAQLEECRADEDHQNLDRQRQPVHGPLHRQAQDSY